MMLATTITYMDAIKVFEQEIQNIRKKYLDTPKKGSRIGIVDAVERDEQLAKCQWAIEVLHKAYRK